MRAHRFVNFNHRGDIAALFCKENIFVMKLLCIFFLLSFVSNAFAFERKHIDIWSDGTRMSGDIFFPDNTDSNLKLPAIIMAHGWGGKRSDLNRYFAPKFIEAGFIVLTFDYRGWQDSDSRLVIVGDQPAINKYGEINVRAKAIREVVDPIDQTRDIFSALDYLSGEGRVDINRIGLWGTSYSGGHVIYIAAQDERVAAVYSQVSFQGIGKNFNKNLYRQRAVEKARGIISPIPQGLDIFPNLSGSADLAKMIGYRPIDWAHKVRVPTLIVDVEDEELFDRKKNGLAVYNIIKQNIDSKYYVFPGRHYDIYYEHFEASNKLALEWFLNYLR